jgi:lysophospholipid acyltransferase (LPLAT)-like uncharacterized protein
VRERFEPSVDPRRADRSTGCIYAIWHRSLLVLSYAYRGMGICVPASQHRDGEIGALAATRLGFRIVRGSSTRGATRLVRGVMEFGEDERGDVALTTDGPRGPAERTKPGCLFLAAKLGWPLVPVGIAARPRRELGSWDRMIVPWPFARIAIVAGAPISIPEEPSTERLAELCRDVDAKMGEVERAAEQLNA